MSNAVNFYHIRDPRWQSTDPDIDKKWRRKEGDEMEFDYARNGDHLMTPFVCDYCVFHKIYGREANLENNKYYLFYRAAALLLIYI